MIHDVRFTDIHSSPKEMQPSRTCISFGEECSITTVVQLMFDAINVRFLAYHSISCAINVRTL